MQRKYKIIGIILIVWATFYITDFTLSKFSKRPIFAIPGATYKDGGTREYYGLGYKVIKYNKSDIIDKECLNNYYEYLELTGEETDLIDISKSGCVTPGRSDVVIGTWFLKVK